MSSALQIQSIAATLDVYHQQLVTLSEALGALHEATEQIRLHLEQDRAALATYTAIAPALHSSVAVATTHDADPKAETLGETPAETLAEALPATAPEPASPMLDDAGVAATQLVSTETAAIEQPALVVEQADEPVAPVAGGHLEPAAVTPDTAVQMTEPEIGTQTASDDAATPADSQSTNSIRAGSNIVPIDAARRKRRGLFPSRRKAMAIAASLVLTASAAFAMHQLYGGEISQRLVDLATCDGDILSAERNCTLLSWLML